MLFISLPVSVKNLCLKFVLIILTSIDNISQNVMLEYFMLNSIFEALVSTFFHPDAREHHGYDAAVALALLVNYRKHEVFMYLCSIVYASIYNHSTFKCMCAYLYCVFFANKVDLILM